MIRPFSHLLLIGSLLLAAPALQAEDISSTAIRDAQEALRELGHYRGEISGVSSVEFRGAVRHFQQQKGLETTGELTGTTREALREATRKESRNTIVSVSPDRTDREAPPAIRAPEPTIVPPAPIAPSHTITEGDRAFLETRESHADEEEVVEAPARIVATPPRAPESEPLLEGGFYEEADPREQSDVLRRATSILRRQGLVDDDPDLSPDVQMEEALFRFQSAEGIRLTGRLDDDTLAAMRLLPRQATTEWRRSGESSEQVEVFRGRVPRSSSERNPYPNAVRGIPLN